MIPKKVYLFLAVGVIVILVAGILVLFTTQNTWAGTSADDVFNIETKEVGKKSVPKI